MRFFYFLANNISYTFAISFFTVFFGMAASAFGLFLGSSFIIFSYDKLIVILIKWFPISILIVSFIHYIQFGFFTPIRIPALFKSHRMMNNSFKADLKMGIADLKTVYGNFSDFTMHNTIAAVFYSVLNGITMIIFFEYEKRVI